MHTSKAQVIHGAPPLTRAEAEALIPDYVFGTLESEHQRELLEASLPFYPDLADDVHLIQESFRSVESELEVLDRAQAQRLKNLSVHVQERLQRNAERRTYWFRLGRVAVPVLVAGVIAVVMIVDRNTTNDLPVQHTAQHYQPSILTTQEIHTLEHLPLDVQTIKEYIALLGQLDTPVPELADDTTLGIVTQTLLKEETLQAIVANRSVFQDYFDSASVLDAITDEQAETVAYAMRSAMQ
ncbi:MAG: hypothetical protein RML40_11820 [Bacteroidota bacterium]|nr:hypothetical protein [Candidatus Kapabacteria bacterium]MDW8221203.1 hypothetical protein [Bacteroidota bacterium]